LDLDPRPALQDEIANHRLRHVGATVGIDHDRVVIITQRIGASVPLNATRISTDPEA
jgi:hypothetical protein